MEVFALIGFGVLALLVNSTGLTFRHPVAYFIYLSLIVFGLYFFIGYGGLFEIRNLHFTTIVLYLLYVVIFSFGFLLTERLRLKYIIVSSNTDFFRKLVLFILLISVPLSLKYLNGLGYYITDKLFYFKTRHAINYENLSLGFVRVLPSLAIVNFLFSYRYVKNAFTVFISLLLAMFFIYVNTGRTSLLLLLIGSLVVRSSKYGFRFRSFLIPIIFLVLVFGILGIVSNKGGSLDNSLSENIVSLASNMLGYVISPIAAFDYYLENNEPSYALMNTLRFPSALLNSIGFDVEMADIVQPFVKIPFITNVYGLPHYYYSDMGALYSILIVLFFGLIFGLLYTKNNMSFLPLIIRVIIFYVLTMFYFQDQVLSILSLWLQILIWSFLYAKYSNSSL